MVENCRNKTEGLAILPETKDVPMPEKKVTNPVSFSETQGPAPYVESDSAPVDYEAEIVKNGQTGCDSLKFVSTNLLPKDDVNLDDTFEEFSPANLEGQNLLDSRNFTIGMQSQVLRNANLQLRSEPTNPQEAVCAWNQSTIAPEARRKMDIGASAVGA